MELGGIRREGEQKLFLISTTHGAETTGLAAMLATIEAFEAQRMIAENWKRGEALGQTVRDLIRRHGLERNLELVGYPCLAALMCKDANGRGDDSFRTLFMQEMIANGVLFQGILFPTWSHAAAEMEAIAKAFDAACTIYRRAVEAGSVEGLLVGPPAKPVFRRRI